MILESAFCEFSVADVCIYKQQQTECYLVLKFNMKLFLRNKVYFCQV